MRGWSGGGGKRRRGSYFSFSGSRWVGGSGNAVSVNFIKCVRGGARDTVNSAATYIEFSCPDVNLSHRITLSRSPRVLQRANLKGRSSAGIYTLPRAPLEPLAVVRARRIIYIRIKEHAAEGERKERKDETGRKPHARQLSGESRGFDDGALLRIISLI